jgi:hypothetical protein
MTGAVDAAAMMEDRCVFQGWLVVCLGWRAGCKRTLSHPSSTIIELTTPIAPGAPRFFQITKGRPPRGRCSSPSTARRRWRGRAGARCGGGARNCPACFAVSRCARAAAFLPTLFTFIPRSLTSTPPQKQTPTPTPKPKTNQKPGRWTSLPSRASSAAATRRPSI